MDDGSHLIFNVLNSGDVPQYYISQITEDNKLLNDTIETAQKNGVFYEYIQQLTDEGIPIDDKYLTEYYELDKHLNNTINTIQLIKQIANNNNMNIAIIKLHDSLAHYPRDIDIFLENKDVERFIRLLQRNGMDLLYSGGNETQLSGEHSKIDIYTRIRYAGIDFLEPETILCSTQTNEFLGTPYPGLSDHLDLLMLVPHHVLGHRRVTLLDLFHLNRRIDEVDLEQSRNIARAHGWEYLFNNSIAYLDQLEARVSNGELIKFPHILPPTFVRENLYRCDQCNLTLREKAFLNLSFYLQGTIYRLEGTKLYNLVKSWGPARKKVNDVSSYFKIKRGDKTSKE